MVNIVVIEKTGEAATSNYTHDDGFSNLYKKCHFRKDAGFSQQVEWKTRLDGRRYTLRVFGRDEGKHNAVNAFEFPPPIDTKLIYGACAVVSISDGGDPEDLDAELWSRLYKKLYGGFEDLSKTEQEDEIEEDELDGVPGEMKTTTGYLKDGFVVETGDSSDDPPDSDNEKLLSSHTETEEDPCDSAGESEECLSSDQESELSHEDYLDE